MSARSCLVAVKILVLVGLLLKFSFILAVAALLCMQSSFCCSSAVSMRLRPIRTRSGLKCFGGFHIKRLNLFLCLRGPLT